MLMRTLARRFILNLLAWSAGAAMAQPEASVPYTPSWMARHALTSLVDQADLPMLVSHWPLPHLAVVASLDAWERDFPEQALRTEVSDWLKVIRRDLQAQHASALSLGLRNQREALVGFDDPVMPGATLAWRAEPFLREFAGFSLAGRLGIQVSKSASSLPVRHQPSEPSLQPIETSLVWARHGWSIQAGMQRQWWGPGWQSSLVNGHNQPGWIGFFLQRSSVLASDRPWLSWMGPWQLEFTVAQANDPEVADQQPLRYLFSGARLTMRPTPWLELGLSRGMQTQGKGRPGGLGRFIESFVGQSTNTWGSDLSDDFSAQVAGFDARIRCPQQWGRCAAYTQWMGEDAAGKVLPLPYKFMTQWGLEHSWQGGRHRAFWEYTQTEGNSLPWDDRSTRFPGYLNGVYVQGYTNFSRWIGAAQGAGSRVHTLGWMDAHAQHQYKLHWGVVGQSIGAYVPGVNAPRGQLLGLGWKQHLRWRGFGWTPELAWIRLQEGSDTGVQRRDSLRLGLTITSH